MNYGYFDDDNKEYVITKPDTPAPWVNYLGDPNYGAIISNNAGGYSFVKSGANGRILRYIFNNFDEPGRYIYIKDNKTDDYWSTSWAPVYKDLNEYNSECHHGLGYSTFISTYKDINSKVTYYVPLNKMYEVWFVTLKNNSSETKELSVTGYCEFTNECNYEQDLVNLQYSLFINKTRFDRNRITNEVKANFKESKPEEYEERFFGLVNQKIDSYTGNKEKFLGRYHRYHNPIGVINGDLGNSLNFNMTSCGALTSKISLKPNEEIKFAYILGMHKSETAEKILDDYKDIDKCEKEIKELKDYWRNKLSSFVVKTPSSEFNSMINTWHSYNCFMTFIWSRAASLIYCGLRNGYGYRDTVQDIQGVIHLDPKAAKDKLSFMLSAQVNNGAGLPLVKFTHNAGHEDTPDDPSYVKETGHPAYRADDALWLFPTVYKYIGETGELEYLDEVILYANKDKDTVYNHLKKAIEFSHNNLGKHNLPVGLHADWNDCLRLGKYGESIFVGMQYYYALRIMKEFAEYKKDKDYELFLNEELTNIKVALDDAYDIDRYIRGYSEDGLTIGKRTNSEANMWLNPQSWAVVSEAADKSRSRVILDKVYEILNTKYGAELMEPPFVKEAFDGALALIYSPGNKENSSIFLQTQGWLILAESLLGNGDRAFEYYKESCPAYQNDIAEVRVIEPYCYGQFTEGRHSDNFGRSNVHWLTGTASTVMVGCVEGMLGIRPNLKGLVLRPALPKDWDKVEIDKVYRNKKLHITIINETMKDNNFVKMVVNGKEFNDNLIKEEMLLDDNEIELTI